ncbi:hypothetical protein Q8A73_002254 [Channa argus]|nr:hypothetical protein Q8A73_002254 [Channa argus]
MARLMSTHRSGVSLAYMLNFGNGRDGLQKALMAGAFLLPALSPKDGIPVVQAGSCCAVLHCDEFSTDVFLLSLLSTLPVLLFLPACLQPSLSLRIQSMCSTDGRSKAKMTSTVPKLSLTASPGSYTPTFTHILGNWLPDSSSIQPGPTRLCPSAHCLNWASITNLFAVLTESKRAWS